MRLSILLISTFFASLFLFIPSSKANPVQQPHIEAELVSEVVSIQPGIPFWMALRLKMEPGWHTYWQNPGDSGLATSIEWKLPPGFTAGPIQWPYPERIEAPPLLSYGYEGEVMLLVEITPPATLKEGEEVTLQAHADWLVCKESCIPGEANLTFTLPIKSSPSQAPVFSNWKQRFDLARQKLPKKVENSVWQLQLESKKGGFLIHLSPRENVQRIASTPRIIDFFPFMEGVIKTEKSSNAQKELFLKLLAPQNLPMQGILLVQEGSEQPEALIIEIGGNSQESSSQVEAAPHAETSLLSKKIPETGFLSSIFFAFLGGLILNLMPCVFPVLSLKILSFVKQAGESKQSLRAHGLAFTAGVLISFWGLAGLLLALRAGGEHLGWGFQLQNPAIVTFLALLLFALGLNLLGVFEIGTSLMGVASSRSASGLSQSFFSGILATLVATPCTAPFMGVALAFALVQPLSVAFLIFTSLALGLAAPYLLLSFSPTLLRVLPRPGAWMESFKQAMAFPLFGAVVWLIWVLSLQAGSLAVLLALSAVVCLALAGWIYGRWYLSHLSIRTRVLSFLFSILLMTLALSSIWAISKLPTPTAVSSTPSSGLSWQPFSAQKIETLKTQGKPIFIDFTAAWCLTCQVNKAVVLQSEKVKKRFQELEVILVEADWTNRDPSIAQALSTYGRSGVPCYVLYDRHGNFEILPELLTPEIMLQALDRASH